MQRASLNGFGAPLRAAAAELRAPLIELLGFLVRPVVFIVLPLGLLKSWLLNLLRLLIFVVVLLPYFASPTLRYVLSPHIRRGVRYGKSVRAAVDIYVPLDADGNAARHSNGVAADDNSELCCKPVIIFVSGGAWIIGYRMWGFLLGLALQRRGIVCVSVDYRNFPQARIPEMVDDVAAACDWVQHNIRRYGGDPNSISLVGQSAGAHLTALMLLRRVATSERSSSAPSALFLPARWIGISGPYDMKALAPALRERGLHPSLIDALASNDLDGCSPTILLSGGGSLLASRPPGAAATAPPMRRWPPTALYHGTADKTVGIAQSSAFAKALRDAGAPSVLEHYFEGKTHTDPILEDPLSSTEDPLLDEVLRFVSGAAAAEVKHSMRIVPASKRVRSILVRIARWINPF